jgi:SAM-dependent methyltransferase
VDATTAWADNLEEELTFWRSALADPGPNGERQRARAERRPVWDELRTRVPGSVERVRMLDVGSGPLTTLGTEWDGRQVEVVAVDPLADAYQRVLDELGIVAPAPARAIRGEQLEQHFDLSSFHVVHAANSLDHTEDPVATIRQMLSVLCPGGTMCLLHHVDVGVMEQYHGLHQWNLRPDGPDDMCIWSRDASATLSDLAPGAVIEVELLRDGIFRVWLTKPAG